jgi:peroxiredoxin
MNGMPTRSKILTWRVAVAASLVLLAVYATPPARAAPPSPGQTAPDFTLKSDSGKNLRLSEFRGQVVLINFWASWCGPCRQEMPLLDKLYDQYRNTGFILLGVNVDENTENGNAMSRRLGVRFPVLFDREQRVSRLYNLDAMPATLLIDRDGAVRYVHRGYKPGYEQAYQAQIRELLKQ